MFSWIKASQPRVSFSILVQKIMIEDLILLSTSLIQIRRTSFRLKSFCSSLFSILYSHLEKWVSNITSGEQQSLNKLCIHFFFTVKIDTWCKGTTTLSTRWSTSIKIESRIRLKWLPLAWLYKWPLDRCNEVGRRGLSRGSRICRQWWVPWAGHGCMKGVTWRHLLLPFWLLCSSPSRIRRAFMLQGHNT